MLKNYLKIAWRNLKRNKSYSFINIGGLALALAVLFIVMLYVRHELSYDEYFSTSDRVHRVLMKDETGKVAFSGTPAEISYELKELYPEVKRSVQVSGPGSEALLQYQDKQFYQDGIIGATSDFFYLFDYNFIHGSRATSLETPKSIVLTQSLSKKLFDGENPVGKSVDFGGTSWRITGVVQNPPPNTHLQFSMVIARQGNIKRPSWNYATGDTYIMLDSPESAKSFNNKLPSYFERHAKYPEDTIIGERGLVLQPITDVYLYPLGKGQASSKMIYIQIFFGVAFLILLIASINYINLATAWSLERAGEIGVRKTVGAGRWQLITQILIETVLTCGIAFVFSLLFVELALPFVDQIFGVSLNTLSWLKPQWIGIIGGLLLVVALLSGGYCAYTISKFSPSGALKGAGYGDVNTSTKLRKTLMVGQFAISLILIITTGLMYQQMDYVRSSRLDGADSKIIVIKKPQHKVLLNQFEEFQQELLKQPAVSQAAAGITMASFDRYMTFENEEGKSSQVFVLNGTFGYLETLDRKIVSGRSLDPTRASDSTRNYVINQTAAQFYGIEEAKGQPIERPVKGNVVGIFEDYHQFSMYEPIKPTLIGVSFNPLVMQNIFVRLKEGQISAGVSQVKKVWDLFETGIPINYYFLDQELDNKYRAELRAVQIFGGFSIFSIFIACLGLFGLAAYTARRRTKEIGIRKVLGATITNIVALLSKDFLKLVALGFIIAVPIAYYAMNQWLADFAYKIEIGPGIFLLAGGLALLIALATVSWQSIRAALANPVDSLRSE